MHVSPDNPIPLRERLDRAFEYRARFVDESHDAAFRLFNGFTEGAPDLAIDVYARTAVVHDYAPAVDNGQGAGIGDNAAIAIAAIRDRLSWCRSIVVKTRGTRNAEARRGVVVFGDQVDREVREHGVRYAVDPMINRDAGLYLDTRSLRAWAIEHLRGKSVLNTFAYTCSLGVAARAGGASRVLDTDRNARFLDVGRASCALNGIPARRGDFRVGDFWPVISQLNRSHERFDCVFLDPPFFATSDKGTVDLEASMTRLVNKVRPLVAHDGWLVAVNNGVYVSGSEYMAQLEALAASGYITLEERIPVGEDFVGEPSLRVTTTVSDPSPFVHSTKIAVLRVRRKDAAPRTG
jgi:23S rRNA (cytosine1962-C5)-methyltransferase